MTAEASAAKRRTTLLWLVVIAAVVAAIVILAVVATGVPQQDEVSSPGSTSSASPSPGTRPTDDGTADPTPLPDASAPPTDPGQPAPPPAQPPAEAPVALTEPAAPVPGVIFSISDLEAVDGVANGPGEVAGPAIRFTLSVRNDTAEVVSLVSTVVNVFAGADRAPAAELGEPGGVPLPETVAPGQSATAVFVFNVPTAQRAQVQISVDYSVDAPIVLFEGAAPR